MGETENAAQQKYCPECKTVFSEDKSFCESCGKPLESDGETISVMGNTEKSKPKRFKVWLPHSVGMIIVLILLAGILLPTKVASYQVEVPYIETEQYTVEVPYEDIEEYIERVPYETTETYVESVPVTESELIRFTRDWVICSSSGLFSTGESTMKITNIDTEGGTFTVKIGYKDNSGNFIGNTESKSVGRGASQTWTYSPTPSSFDQCWYSIENTPTKATIEYKDVVKERDVTKYRDETRYRKVTKTRTETREREVRKTRTETWHKEVNWAFGFDAIVKFRNL